MKPITLFTWILVSTAILLGQTQAFHISHSSVKSLIATPIISKKPDPRHPLSHVTRIQPLHLAKDSSGGKGELTKIDPLVKDVGLLTRRLSWLSWWSQLILTTVSAVTLVFARNVIRQSHPSIAAANSLPNFVLAGGGIVAGYASLFWTWASRRLARRLLRKPTTKIQSANMLRSTIKVGLTLNIIGMLFTIVGAEQIVGALAIKVLTTSRTLAIDQSSSLIQPLDILVVQANTNTLFSHFTSLVALLYLAKQLCKLDPPSVEGDERSR
ncbi:unnamed protein product [Cylindrotheca closterium]|uniref:DUF3611 family protein n=1 Tax=Cylindrotheca closterium TaxID=2856 RepID=A0AAD2CRZ9_9STRA|nr:unnamed protein product [Cylindrotheca closterium]